ncbi:thioredoxin family protein [Eisenibacter elegans]|jgi:peroxiredoxin|uniref:thioredoxin family protein n=1 Tax=Eisenibacter elegans TaxID=997 RepID=UPI0003FC25DC|nr:thioredoxin family protein [Eisenibacter elegans]
MKKVLFGFMATALVAAVVLLSSARSNDGYKIGDKARDFKLKNVDGKMVSLADYKDAKGVILIFSCNHCPYVVAYEDRMIALHNKYAAQGFPVVTINPNDPVKQPEDSFEKMQQRAKDKGFPFAYLLDETQEIARTYGATKTPHVFLLKKKDNDFVVKYIGAIDNNHKDPNAVTEKYVEQAVDALLGGQKVNTNTTKAIGCTIKWREM